MPLLAAFLGGLVSELIKVFAVYMTKKTALAAAAITVFALLTIALFAAMKLAVLAVLITVPASASLIAGMQSIMPSNFTACIAAIVSAHTAIAIYKWNMENLKILSYIT